MRNNTYFLLEYIYCLLHRLISNSPRRYSSYFLITFANILFITVSCCLRSLLSGIAYSWKWQIQQWQYMYQRLLSFSLTLQQCKYQDFSHWFCTFFCKHLPINFCAHVLFKFNFLTNIILKLS